jgi:putative Mg2+ transporter-C (MgtC) family protein
MALVSLGAAAFTICSAYGFSGRADPSRMAANVASGVGFLGAGVITTHATMNRQRNYSIVHGLTTAAAIWLSAALGVASGVGLYLVSGTTALTTVVILRLGKRKARRRRRGFEDREWQEEGDDTWEEEKNIDSYHLSDTHDTSDWDEVPDDVVPPYPVGDSLATSFRTVPAAAPVLPPDTEYPPQFEFRNESAIEQIFGISSGKQAKNMTAVDANIMTP